MGSYLKDTAREEPALQQSSRKVYCCTQDEPFHLSQTQRYCQGDWGTWDPKITTFPGLYVAGVAYARTIWQAISLWTQADLVNILASRPISKAACAQ